MRLCLPQDCQGMLNSQQIKSNYFCVLTFLIYRQVYQGQRSLFSIWRPWCCKADSEYDCWISLTTINIVETKEENFSAYHDAVTMKEELCTETVSCPAPFEASLKFNLNHSHGKLCQVMLAYKLLMLQQHDWVQKLPSEHKEVSDKKKEMSTLKRLGHIPMETLTNFIWDHLFVFHFKLTVQEAHVNYLHRRKIRWAFSETAEKEHQQQMN